MADVTISKPKIAILDDYYHRAQHYADWNSCNVADFVFFDKAMSAESELVEKLSGFNAIGIMRERTKEGRGSHVCLLIRCVVFSTPRKIIN